MGSVAGDEGLLRQAFLNLARNAAEAEARALETVPFVMVLVVFLAPAAGLAAVTVPFVIALAVVAAPESVVSGIGSQSK